MINKFKYAKLSLSNNGIYYIIGGIALLIIGTLAIYFVAKPKKVKGSK